MIQRGRNKTTEVRNTINANMIRMSDNFLSERSTQKLNRNIYNGSLNYLR